MKDAKDAVLYIGKAKNLRNRVKSYFSHTQDAKTARLVELICNIEFVLTDTEDEAYILESSMIKRHRPKFNIELKDQERYTYLRITDEKYPRLVVARRTRKGKFLGKGEVYGPFVHGSSKLLTIGTLRKTFKIRICKTLPKKVCLEYHMGNCEGPCEFTEAQERYSVHVRDLVDVLHDPDQAEVFSKKLMAEMDRASELRQFERAREIRDTLHRLGSLRQEQKMAYPHALDEEFFGIKNIDGEAVVMNFRMANGIIRDSDRFVFDIVGDNNFGNFLYQYYTTHLIPDVVVASHKPEEHAVLEKMLSKQSGRQVSIITPNNKMRENMIGLLLRNIDTATVSDPGVMELQKILKMSQPPRIIECFDISNHGDDYAVGAMSRFVDGKPDKSGYRKFRIRDVSGRDDYSMMYEVVKRRYTRLKAENKTMPDMVLIDGGKGQLSSAVAALDDARVDIYCISLAKENEEVYVPHDGNAIIISRSKPSLQLLQRARDESHRFGLKYNHDIRRAQLK